MSGSRGGVAGGVDVVPGQDQAVDGLGRVDLGNGVRGRLDARSAVADVTDDGQVQFERIARWERMPRRGLGGAALAVGGVADDLVAIEDADGRQRQRDDERDDANRQATG